MILREITHRLDEIFKIRTAEHFDNVGLLCGNPEREISGMLVCHDALETVVDEAIKRELNLIIAFHPIIFSGIKSTTATAKIGRASCRERV